MAVLLVAGRRDWNTIGALEMRFFHMGDILLSPYTLNFLEMVPMGNEAVPRMLRQTDEDPFRLQEQRDTFWLKSTENPFVDWDLVADLVAGDLKQAIGWLSVCKGGRLMGTFRPNKLEVRLRNTRLVPLFYVPKPRAPKRRRLEGLELWAAGGVEVPPNGDPDGEPPPLEDEQPPEEELEHVLGGGDPPSEHGDTSEEELDLVSDADPVQDDDGEDKESSSGSSSSSSHRTSSSSDDNVVKASEDETRRLAPPHVDRRGQFPRIMLDKGDHKKMCYLRLSQTRGVEHHDMRSVCGICTATKSLTCKSNRPIGILWAWLKFDCRGNRGHHKAEEPSPEECQLAREEVYGIPESKSWFDAEFEPWRDPRDE